MEVKITSTTSMENTNVVFSQMFNTLRTAKQEGDRFYVPGMNMLVVLSNSVEITGRKEPLLVGQHFPAVKLDEDGKPLEVTELYVGQIVKVDAHGKVVFNNPLAAALRKSGEAFAHAICGKVLVVGEPAKIDDRIWDEENHTWLRETPGDVRSPYKTRESFAFPFTAQSPAKGTDINACDEMLKAYYDENYSDVLKAE